MACGCNKKKKSGARKSSKRTVNRVRRTSNIKKLPIVSTKTIKKTVIINK